VVRPVAVTLCLTGLIAISSSGCATFGRRSREAEAAAACRELSQQGAAAIQAGQWEQAETLLRQGLETSPDNVEIRRQLAEALWHRGSANEAMSHIAAAARLEPNSAPLAVRAGEMALASGAYDAALDRAEDALRLDPRLASAWALRGRTFQKLKNSDRALADLQRSLVFDPDNTETLMELANLYRSIGEPARCLTTLHHLSDTYSLGGEPQEVLMLEGLTLMDLKRPYEAAEVLLAASQRGLPNADVLYHLAEAQSDAGKYADATNSAQQALAIDSTHQASLELLTQLEARASAFEQRHR
jgi:tetratricopeptide (TPR) repeat protein